jgi:hypothetical protein
VSVVTSSPLLAVIRAAKAVVQCTRQCASKAAQHAMSTDPEAQSSTVPLLNGDQVSLMGTGFRCNPTHHLLRRDVPLRVRGDVKRLPVELCWVLHYPQIDHAAKFSAQNLCMAHQVASAHDEHEVDEHQHFSQRCVRQDISFSM